MWRRQTPNIKTANLCNQFLVQYLQKKKMHLENIGMQRKAFVYHGAIASIRKYPLPIISGSQLKLIYGIGQLLCDELVSVIKHHYKDFLKKNAQSTNINHPQSVNSIDQRPNQVDDNSISRTNSKSVAHTTHFQSKQIREDNAEDDSKSCCSVKSATVDRQYKPRANSLAAYIMISIRNLGKGEFVCEQNLKQILQKDYNQNTGKQYSLAIANLIKHNYIQRDPLSLSYVRLTEKGSIDVQKLENKTKIKESQAKIQGLALSFKENRILKKENNTEEKQERSILQLIQTKQEKQLVLLIDTRQKKDQQEQCFFETRLQDKHGVICRSANLPIGDFVWLYGDQVLDYVVERKKADDLISSIFDGRYKQQKYRLKNSGFTNIYYLFEGHLTGSNAMSERQVNSALLKTRVKDEFKVVQVKSISESIKFLSFLTESIQTKIDQSPQIYTLGTLEEFTSNNGKASNLTIEQVLGLSLKTIPGVGKSSINEILKYFNSFKSLYNQLKLLNTTLQRVQFLREVLRGCGVQQKVPELLVDVLFDNRKK